MRLFRKFRSLFQRGKFDAEMAEEMRQHVDLQTALNVKAGMSPDEARYAALRQFGNVGVIQEQAREGWGWVWLEEAAKDARFALRQLRKSPGFTLVAVLTIALGIGANTAIFSGVDAVLLRSLPYPESGRLLHVFSILPRGGANSVSGGVYLDWAKYQTQFEALVITVHERLDLTGLGDPEKIDAAAVSSDLDRLLKIPPLIGRHFRADDDLVGGNNNVVLLSEAFWRTRFGGSPAALGQTVTLDGVPREIIGVLPAGAWHQRDVQLFVPLVLTPNTYRTALDVNMAQVFGRLKPGATLASAVAELRAVKARLDPDYPEWLHAWSVGAEPMQAMLAANPRPFLLMLIGATGLVLLIACANVANLLLARAATRQRELALRAALGASSGRIVRQVLTESLLLAVIGGMAGLLVAAASIHVLAVTSADLLPATMMPQLDFRVLGFGLLTSMLTGLVFGVFPALRARHPDLNRSLKSGAASTTDGGRSRSQSSLVIAEIALTAVLLIATGLLVRGMVRNVTADPGIRPDHLLMFDLTPPYAGPYGDQGQRTAFLNRVRRELLTVPGVIAAAGADDLPFGSGGQGYAVSLEEKPETRQDMVARIKYVSEDYFATLGIRLLRGRLLKSEDNRTGAPAVMVINDTMARTLFGSRVDPLGRLVHARNQPWEVVGVVADPRLDQLHLPPPPTFFVPQAEFPWTSGYIVRTQGDPATFVAAVSAAVHRLDPNLPLANLETVEQAMAAALGPQRLTLQLIGVFAGTALLLAAIGLYGVMAFAVANRRRELSIRVALGAARADIMGLILGHGTRLLASGLGVGLLGGIAVAGVVAHQWVDINANDPLVYVTAAVVLSLVTFLACWLPARRAAKADPIVALRAE